MTDGLVERVARAIFGHARDADEIIEEGASYHGRFVVGEWFQGPTDAVSGGRPDATDFMAAAVREVPEAERDLVRATHDVNKKLTNYIRQGLTIGVGRSARLLAGRNSIRKK